MATTVYLKNGTSDVLLVNNDVAIDQACCCEAHPYHVFFCGGPQFAFPSGVRVSFQICAQTQSQILCFSCGHGCVDTSINGRLALQYQGFGASVNGPTSVILSSGVATVTLTAFGGTFTSFNISTPDSSDGPGNSFCTYTMA